MGQPRIPAATANLMLDAGIGGVANNGKLAIYDGTQPASGGGAITSQVKLVEFTMPADAFPAAVGGVLTANGIPPVAALATGTASWYRMFRSDGTTVIKDGSVGLADSVDQPDCVIDDVNVVQGQVVAVGSLVIAQPLG